MPGSLRACQKHAQSALAAVSGKWPVPGKRSPGDRCKAEGASYAGENIAMGMNTGRGAFNAWYTSSGHHRNMLMKGHVSIGIGNSQSGRYWTQNFGYDNPGPRRS